MVAFKPVLFAALLGLILMTAVDDVVAPFVQPPTAALSTAMAGQRSRNEEGTGSNGPDPMEALYEEKRQQRKAEEMLNAMNSHGAKPEWEPVPVRYAPGASSHGAYYSADSGRGKHKHHGCGLLACFGCRGC